MSRIEKCLNAKVEAGELSREQAEAALKAVKAMQAERAKDLGPGGKNPLRDPLDEIEGLRRKLAEAKEKKRQAALQALAVNRVAERQDAHPEGVWHGAASQLGRDWTGKAGHVDNVEARQSAVRNVLRGMLSEGIQRYRSKLFGLRRDKAGPIAVVRALFGETSGDQVADAVGRAFGEAAEYARQRRNAAGGRTPKRKDWRLPQRMSRHRLKAMGKAAFADYMHRALEEGRLKIADWRTGLDVDPLKAAEIIDQAYERIVTDGLSDLTPGAPGGKSLGNRRADPRVFEWTSADAWLDANRTLGDGDAAIFDNLISHLDGMADDIGLMEILGPNPAHTARVLVDRAKKAGKTGLPAYQLEALYDQVSGAASTPVSQNLSAIFSGLRAMQTAAKLGSAMLSAVTDFNTLAMTSMWNGLPASKVVANYVRLWADPNMRKNARRLGLITEVGLDRANVALRENVAQAGRGIFQSAADVVLRASGLAPHTELARWAFGMEMLGQLADQARTPFAELPKRMRQALERYGVDADDWAVIAKEGLVDFDGAEFVWIEQLARSGSAGKRAADKLGGLLQTETDFAVPIADARARSLMLGRSRPGTVGGEMLRAMGQFKAFPVAMLALHGLRGVQSLRAGDKGLYLAAGAVGMTALGAFALQAKQYANGKDPRDMTTWEFWGAAFLQGGGAGIFGDYLYAAVNRADLSFYATITGGPTTGFIDDVVRLIGPNIGAGLDEDRDVAFGARLARFVRNNTPGASLWYGRLAADRLLFNQLQLALDPKAKRSFRRLEKRARREYGQRFWWRPGRSAPSRAPNLSAAFGGRS